MFDPPLSDRELWDCAILVEKQCGEEAPAFIIQRLTALAKEGDEASIAVWKAIAERYDRLQKCEPSRRRLPI
jgi:hypothetical protein